MSFRQTELFKCFLLLKYINKKKKKKKKIEDTNLKFEYSDLIHVDYG